MPLFGLGRKNDGPRPSLKHPRELPGNGDDEKLRLLGVAQSRDWNTLRAEFAKLHGHDLSSLIGNVCNATPDISQWVPDDAGDALAQAVLGADAIERGWRVRTAKRAQHVSAEQFREFHEILRVAETHLYASAELDDSSVAPWYSLMITGRGLQVGLEAQQRRFEAAVKRSPGHLGVHRQMLQQLCRKWGGSHEQMHAFATEAMRGPHGGVLGEQVPWAYYEHVGDLPKDSLDRLFITYEAAQSELREAAQRTIFRPDYSCPRSPYQAANVFTWVFSQARMWPEAMAAFEATRGVVVDWASFNDPVKAYTTRLEHVRKHL